jgi:hypothetical protein
VKVKKLHKIHSKVDKNCASDWADIFKTPVLVRKVNSLKPFSRSVCPPTETKTPETLLFEENVKPRCRILKLFIAGCS